MIITEFNNTHMPQAMDIARMSYEDERKCVKMLPKVEMLPELEHFATNHLGAAAMEGDRLLGYLGAYVPIEDAFGTTRVRGTFSPIHAHGVINQGLDSRMRERIYSLLYQEAARRWVQAGIRSHALAIYTYDKDAMKSFFYNGFGLRCIDAINSLEELMGLELKSIPQGLQVEYVEVPRAEWSCLLGQHNELIKHLGDSPTFMRFQEIDETELYRRTSEDIRYFAAKADGRYIAYIKLGNEGENFVTNDPSMMNICGAFCEPTYRGSGLYHNLLLSIVKILKNEGYQLLGVDCESFNPNARGFWLKYFYEYTHSVVRRIDESVFCE